MIDALLVGGFSGGFLMLSLFVGQFVVSKFAKTRPGAFSSLIVGCVIVAPLTLIPLAFLSDYNRSRTSAEIAAKDASKKNAFMKEYCAQRRALNDAPADCSKW